MTETATTIEPAPSDAAAYLLTEVLDWMLEQEAPTIGDQWLERRRADLPEVLVVDGVIVR